MKKLMSLVLALALMLTMASALSALAEGDTVELVVYQRLGSDDRNALLQRILDEAGMNVHLTFVDGTGDQAYTKYAMMMQAGETIDLVMDVDPGTSYSEFFTNNWMVPLDDYVADWEDWGYMSETDHEFAKSILDGKTYFVPYGKYYKVLFYRSDWLEEAGIAVPTTWEEIYEASVKLTDKANNRYGYSWRGNGGAGIFYMYSPNLFPYAEVYPGEDGGPSVTEILRDGSCVWSHTETMTQALEFWKKLFTDCSPADSLTWGYPESVEAFYSGVCAFLIQDCEVIATCEKYMEEGTWNTAPLPASPEGYMYTTGTPGGPGAGVCSNTSNEEVAVEALKTLFGVEGALKFCDGYGLIPVYSSAEGYDLGYYQPYADMESTGKLIKNACGWLESLKDDDDRDFLDNLGYTLDTEIQGLLTDQITAEQVVDDMVELYSWVDDKPEIIAIREGAAQ